VSTTVGDVLIIADVDNQDFSAGPGGVLIDDIGSVAASNGDVTITGTAFTNLGGTGSFGQFVDDAIIVLADGGGADQINAAGDISLITDGDPLVGTGNIVINGDITSTAGDISSISIGSTLLGGAATLNAANTLSIRIDSLNNSSTLLDLGDAVLTGTTITLTGGDDSNETLFGQDIDTTWTITGDDTGTLSNGNINSVANFVNFQNLTGGTAADTFSITAGSISGNVDGDAGNDTLDYSSGPAATITLTGLGSVDGFQGNTAEIANFDNIDDLVGSGATTDSLAGDIDAGGTFTVGAGGNTYSSGPNSLTFSGIEDLFGGAGTDIFNVNTDHSGNIDPGAENDIFNLSGGSTITGTVTDTIGNNTFDLSGNVSGGVSGGTGDDTYTISGNSQLNITDAGGNNDIFVNAPLTGSLSLAGDANDNNEIEINADISGGINGGDGNETINFNGGILTTDVNAGGGRNIYNFNGGSATGTFNITGDDVWNHAPDQSLGTTVIGDGALAVADPNLGDLIIGVDTSNPDNLLLPDLAAFEGHLIIGGTIEPGFPPLDGDETITINTDNMTVTPANIISAGDITLLASNIFIEGESLVSAGGPGGNGNGTDQVTLIAVGDANGGSGPGDITGVSFPGTVEGATALFIAQNDIVNAENLVIELNGGEIQTPIGSGLTPAFGFLDAIPVGPSEPTLAFLDALAAGTGLNINLLTFVQAQTLILTNLIGLEQISFIDVGLFEEDLTLFGTIGQGIALSLAQCEEIEGCAPNISEAELNELIEQLDGRITELERRLEEADVSDRGQLETLLAGYRAELENFNNYRNELQDFYATEDEFDDDFADEFGEDLATIEIRRLNNILEMVQARIAWLESLKSNTQARTRLGEQSGIELTIEAIDSIIQATRQQVRLIERQIQQLLSGSQAKIEPIFQAETGDLAMTRFPAYKNELFSYDAYIYQKKDVWY
jgi:hypothetical protein